MSKEDVCRPASLKFTIDNILNIDVFKSAKSRATQDVAYQCSKDRRNRSPHTIISDESGKLGTTTPFALVCHVAYFTFIRVIVLIAFISFISAASHRMCFQLERRLEYSSWTRGYAKCVWRASQNGKPEEHRRGSLRTEKRQKTQTTNKKENAHNFLQKANFSVRSNIWHEKIPEQRRANLSCQLSPTHRDASENMVSKPSE